MIFPPTTEGFCHRIFAVHWPARTACTVGGVWRTKSGSPAPTAGVGSLSGAWWSLEFFFSKGCPMISHFLGWFFDLAVWCFFSLFAVVFIAWHDGKMVVNCGGNPRKKGHLTGAFQCLHHQILSGRFRLLFRRSADTCSHQLRSFLPS